MTTPMHDYSAALTAAERHTGSTETDTDKRVVTKHVQKPL